MLHLLDDSRQLLGSSASRTLSEQVERLRVGHSVAVVAQWGGLQLRARRRRANVAASDRHDQLVGRAIAGHDAVELRGDKRAERQQSQRPRRRGRSGLAEGCQPPVFLMNCPFFGG